LAMASNLVQLRARHGYIHGNISWDTSDLDGLIQKKCMAYIQLWLCEDKPSLIVVITHNLWKILGDVEVGGGGSTPAEGI
jgi:hypothetical protein